MTKMTTKAKKKEKRNEQQIIDVSRKSTIEIVYEFDDYDYNELRKEFKNISNDIQRTYYSSNAAIERIEKRNFFDLVDIYIDSWKEKYLSKRKV